MPPGQKPSIRSGAPKPPSVRLAFLANLRLGHSVARAAREAGTARRTVFEWKAADSEFAKAWEDAYDEGTDLIEDEATRRAVEGCDRPVFQGGIQVGVVREYSDTLANLMLQGRRPEKFRKSSVELTGPNGGPIQAKMEIEFVEAPKPQAPVKK